MHKGVKSSVIYSWAAALFTYQCILLLRLVSCAAHCTVAVSISCIHLITVAAHQKLSATALLERARPMHASECEAEQEGSTHRESRVGESNSGWAALTERSGRAGSTIVALFCASVAIINYIFSLWPNNFLFLDLRKQVPHQFHHTQILHAVWRRQSNDWSLECTEIATACHTVRGKKQSGSLILIYHSRINKTKTRKQQRTKSQRE